MGRYSRVALVLTASSPTMTTHIDLFTKVPTVQLRTMEYCTNGGFLVLASRAELSREADEYITRLILSAKNAARSGALTAGSVEQEIVDYTLSHIKSGQNPNKKKTSSNPSSAKKQPVEPAPDTAAVEGKEDGSRRRRRTRTKKLVHNYPQGSLEDKAFQLDVPKNICNALLQFSRFGKKITSIGAVKNVQYLPSIQSTLPGDTPDLHG